MIITSLLDNDLYKFTSSHAYSIRYPHAQGIFKFTDRNQMVYPKGFAALLQREVEEMARLELSPEEEFFLKEQVRFLPPPYVDFLKGFRYDPSEVKIAQDPDGRLEVTITGNLYRITLWEVPLLALISELYYQVKGEHAEGVRERTMAKIGILNSGDVSFAEFGTRRRFSFDVQRDVIRLLSEHAHHLIGTSNVFFAMRFKLPVSGTFPHEWIQFHGANFGYRMGNYSGLEAWQEVYHGDLGIALADTYTSKVFFDNFSKEHAKLFDGVRQDSGEPEAFVDLALARYKELNVNPASKMIIFSDSLTAERTVNIKRYCDARIRAAFGIGTHLTNDFGVKPMNIVIKLQACRMTPRLPWLGCVKLSDVKGKESGTEKDIRICKEVLGIE
ncbi:MAG: nicotinate phosphoribosyltransferase [Bacteroidales bacterium]